MDASQHFNAPFRSRLEQLGYHVSSPHHHEVTLSIEALQDALMALHSDCKASSNPTPHISAFVGKFEKAVAVLQGLRVNTQDFDVIKTLATGAVGRVCLVAGKVDKRVYAMKVLKKTDLLTRREAAFFMEERNALVFAQNSRWIITLHAAFQDEENLYLLMEYVAGGSLRGLLNSRNTIMTEDEARFYIAEIILGLEEVHKYNYIHRDIKPENVLIDTKGHLKLGDFGSCIRVGETEQITSHETVGTPDYISPEILRAQEGRASYGKEVDLWSLGIILYELIYDEVPFYSESLVATYGKIMDHENTLKFPAGPSDSAIDLMKRLICSSDKRLGKSGIEELKSHVWFQGFNWSQLLEMTPPFIPHLNGPQDTRYFEDEDNESKKFSKKPLGKSRDFTGQNLPFIGYTYLQDATPSFSWPFEMAISSQATSSRTNFGVTAELEAVMSQNTTYSHQITELELAVTRALDEKKRIEIDLKRSQSLAAHETAEKEELESRIRSFRKRQQDHDVEMEVRLSTVEHERDTLLDQLATLKENALSREEMFAKQEVYKMQLQKTNEFLQQEIERLKSKLSDEKMTLRTLQAKIDLLTQKMEDENEFRAASTIERNDMSEQFQVALQKVSSLESALAAEVEKANLASAALCEMERSKCIVEIELKTARNQLEMANAKRLPKDSDRVLGIKDLHAQIESLLKQNSSYVDEMSQLTKSNAQLELEIADINEQRNEKLNQFQLTVQVTNNMEVKLREYEKKIAALEKQRSAREAQHAAALAEKNAALQDARDEILKIQSSLSKLNESLSQKSLDVIAIRQSLLEREQSITNLKITNTELLNHFENDRQTIEKLECSVHTLQQESNRQSLECFRHADTISELRNENERLRDEKTLRRASINDLDLQTSVIARLEQSLREKAAALTESETHRALEINQNLLLQDRVRELENWSLALQDEWEVNKAKFNGTGTSTPTYTMSPTAESRSDKNKLKLRSLFFRSQQQRQDQERAMQKLHDAESDFRSVDTPVHTRQKSNGSFQSLVSHFTRHSEQSLFFEIDMNYNLHGLLKIPKAGKVRKGWRQKYAVVKDMKLYIYDRERDAESSEGALVADLRSDVFIVRAVPQNELIHTTAKQIECIFKIQSAFAEMEHQSTSTAATTVEISKSIEKLRHEVEQDGKMKSAVERMLAACAPSDLQRPVLQLQMESYQNGIESKISELDILHAKIVAIQSLDPELDLEEITNQSFEEDLANAKKIIQSQLDDEYRKRADLKKLLKLPTSNEPTANGKSIMDEITSVETAVQKLQADLAIIASDDAASKQSIVRKLINSQRNHHGHFFRRKQNYLANQPAACAYCQDALWGNQSLECSRCKIQCHNACHNLIALSCAEVSALKEIPPLYFMAESPSERARWVSALDYFRKELKRPPGSESANTSRANSIMHDGTSVHCSTPPFASQHHPPLPTGSRTVSSWYTRLPFHLNESPKLARSGTGVSRNRNASLSSSLSLSESTLAQSQPQLNSYGSGAMTSRPTSETCSSRILSYQNLVTKQTPTRRKESLGKGGPASLKARGALSEADISRE